MAKRSVMSRKAFHVAIEFDIHAVTCPGVWLCPKGMVMLRVTILGATEHTKRIQPIFPLLFHERFHFQKMFPEVGSLSELTEVLKRINTHIELIQIQENKCKGKLLASFKRSMTEVLSPTTADKGLVAGVDVDLLMEGTDCFPGILAPKIEVSTRVIIEEIINSPTYESWVVNPVTISSCKSPERTKDKICKEQKSLMRQKRVCHRKQKPICVCCKPNFNNSGKATQKQKSQTVEITQEGLRKGKPDAGNKCYCCQRCGKELDVENHGEVIVRKEDIVKEINKCDICLCKTKQQCVSTKSSCDCRVCLKYNHVFSCSCDSAQDNTLSDISSLKGGPPSPVITHKRVNSRCCESGKPCACFQPRKHSPARIQHCFCKEAVNCYCKTYPLNRPANPW